MQSCSRGKKRTVRQVRARALCKPKLDSVSRKTTKHENLQKLPAATGPGIEAATRKAGIDILGDISWGTHLCLFYQRNNDLFRVLVPYLKAGLENNEFCMWITSESPSKEQAKAALRKAIPNFAVYLRKGQIEILDYKQWYVRKGRFDRQRVVKGWSNKLTQALANGYAGMRVVGDLSWVGEKVWEQFIAYESRINELIDRLRMIACCVYPLARCGPAQIIEVVNTHQLALIQQEHESKLVKNAERRKAQIRARQYQSQLQSLASQLTVAEERERRRIAAELHDGIGQALAISKIKLDALSHSAHTSEHARALEEVSSALGEAVAEARSLTFDLSSPILAELGFEAAVAAWLAEQIEAKHRIRTEFQDDRQPKPLDDDVRAILFRNVREMLMNVVRHAKAQKVKVSVEKIGNRIQVAVQDDGVGFETSEALASAARQGRFGLFSIRERLEQLGGRLGIESAPGRGCQVTMTAPLKLDKG